MAETKVFPIGTRLVLNPNSPYDNTHILYVVGGNKGTIFEVVKVSRELVYVKVAGANDGKVYGGYYPTRFIEAPRTVNTAPVADTLRRATAMTAEQARALRDRLVDAGVPKDGVRLRSRSWDNDARYFAIEVEEGTEKATFYTVAKGDEWLAARKLRLTPIDIEPYLETLRAGVTVRQFKTTDGAFLRSPDGSYWWSPVDIARCKGLVEQNGKRYRLGSKTFVPFVQ